MFLQKKKETKKNGHTEREIVNNCRHMVILCIDLPKGQWGSAEDMLERIDRDLESWKYVEKKKSIALLLKHILVERTIKIMCSFIFLLIVHFVCFPCI